MKNNEKAGAAITIGFRVPPDRHQKLCEEALDYPNMTTMMLSKLDACERAEEENGKLKRQVKELEDRLSKTIAKSDEVQSKNDQLQARNAQLLDLNKFLEKRENERQGFETSSKENKEKADIFEQRLMYLFLALTKKRNEKTSFFASKASFTEQEMNELWLMSNIMRAETLESSEGKTLCILKPYEWKNQGVAAFVREMQINSITIIGIDGK
jgi:predicted RNase H-like nuclease (RuvC/YqgF family)